jgi:hypothetical protein
MRFVDRTSVVRAVRCVALPLAWVGLAGSHASAGDGLFRPVLVDGLAVPGFASVFDGATLAGVDATGSVVIGSFRASGRPYSGLFHVDHAGVVTSLVAPDVTESQPRSLIRVTDASDYQNGTMLFNAHTPIGDVLYRYTPAGLETVLASQQVLPDVNATIDASGFYGRGFSERDGVVAVGIKRSDASYGVYIVRNGAIEPITDTRLRAPAPEMGNFISFPDVMWAGDRAVFVGKAEERDRPGHVENAGIFQSVPGDAVNPLIIRQRAIPGNPNDNWRFREFEKPRLQADGRVAFTGGFIDEYNPGSRDNHMGVYLSTFGGVPERLIDSEMPLPGLQDEIFEFTGYWLEGTGRRVYAAIDFAHESYLFVEDGAGGYINLVDSYGTLDGRPISRLRLAGDSGHADRVYFTAWFEDGGSGVYSVVVPEPVSVAGVALGAVVLLRRRRV